MAKQPLVNGRTARQLAVVMENCIKRDSCGTCPYDKMHSRGMSCVDYMITDAITALRRMQKRYDNQRSRYYLDKDKMRSEIMREPLFIVWFSDPEYKEVRMLGAFATYEEAKAYAEAREIDRKKTGVLENAIIGVSQAPDRRKEDGK